jgi:Flp pilus assembly protein TadD
MPHFFLAAVYDRHDMFDEAKAEYEATLDIDAYHLKALFNLGNLYLQEGNHKEATRCYKRVLVLDPKDRPAWMNLGSVYEETGDYRRADRAYREALTLDPYAEDTNFNLALMQVLQYGAGMSADQKRDIVRRLHFVLSLNPNNKKADSLLQQLEKK